MNDHISHHAPLVISQVAAQQILDSRGYPTIQVEFRLGDGERVRASTPAGASTGAHEALELRDGGRAYSGKGVHCAVSTINGELAELLVSRGWESIGQLDAALRRLDGKPRLSRLGGNSVVAVSMAAARGFAHASGQTLHGWAASAMGTTERLPVPHFNVLNGGVHAPNDLAFQEFMIAPVGASSFEQAVQCGAEIYHALAGGIRRAYTDTGLGDEGGFAPPITRPEDALDLLMHAIVEAGYTPGLTSVAIAIDPAANSFFHNDAYQLEGGTISSAELVDYYARLVGNYPIRSIEDGFAETDEDGWRQLCEQLGDTIQIVGDDLFVTDAVRIERGFRLGLANAALIKPNQIGTVSQTFSAIVAARDHGMGSMISHRSGETLDTFIADLAVASGSGQIKSGAPARGERVAKYNRILEIEAENPRRPYGLTGV